jgi:hypothetical protein
VVHVSGEGQKNLFDGMTKVSGIMHILVLPILGGVR